MMRRFIILAVTALLFLAPVAQAAGWEEITRPPRQTEHIESEDIDIVIRDGYVYVIADHAVTVKIFTILGQSVAQSTLTPGAYRFKLPAKGIYILKVGSATRRITV